MSAAFAASEHRTFPDLASLRAFGAALAQRLRPGDVVAIAGPIGAGKTTLVQAIVRTLHGPVASSPTFTFRHRYDPQRGGAPIEHLDLYRVDDPSELTELGLEDAFDGEAIVLVEWWRNAPALLPARRYEVDLDGAGDEPRRLTLHAPT